MTISSEEASTSVGADTAIHPFRIDFPQFDRGGHFAAWEQPQLFSEEMRAAFRSLR
jgi:hypothetical protein